MESHPFKKLLTNKTYLIIEKYNDGTCYVVSRHRPYFLSLIQGEALGKGLGPAPVPEVQLVVSADDEHAVYWVECQRRNHGLAFCHPDFTASLSTQKDNDK